MIVNAAQKQEALRSSGNTSHPILDKRPRLGEDTPDVGALWDILMRLQVGWILRVQATVHWRTSHKGRP
jgi:hypothetical protein